jgi:hypothetical protein
LAVPVFPCVRPSDGSLSAFGDKLSRFTAGKYFLRFNCHRAYRGRMATKKQTELHIEGKGVSPANIPEIDKLADDYIKERDKRMKQTPREVAAKGKLIDALHEHADQLKNPDGDILYRMDSLLITLTAGKEKLQVRDVSEQDEAQ